jgi:poly(hydroxyalkanoate) depolymerase family esterase
VPRAQKNPAFFREGKDRILHPFGQFSLETPKWRSLSPEPVEPFVEIGDFGSNPGNLRMLAYVPETVGCDIPLVVVLHGCHQNADDFGRDSGWLDLALRHRFALLLPEQRPENNRNRCFTWFRTQDIQRDQGEALSIRQMLAKLVVDHDIDPRRIFVAGLSAGGAMAGTLLATYPEIFAAGAIVAGLPYRSALNVQQALRVMRHPTARAPSEWGDFVRHASPYPARWPKVSIWHGNADATVEPANAEAIAAQWLNVHALTWAAGTNMNGPGCARTLWKNAAGAEVVELITIDEMDHGWPVDPQGQTGAPCGTAEQFLIDTGQSAARKSAERWDLLTRRPTLSKVLGMVRG